MNDYIKREDPIHSLENGLAYIRLFGAGRCLGMIRDIPSADVVEVVRCKDCKHYKRNIPCVGGHYNGCDEWLDEGNAITVYDNDYCSYGERTDT